MRRSIDIHIGKRLKIVRQQKKLSRLDIEIGANIEKGSIEKFEDGTRTIKPSELFQIANLLMTTMGFFYKDPKLNYGKINTEKSTKIKENTMQNGKA